ncbi:MAG TPA: bacillithiol biosynthesis cysteine-adding enzyme BshC [Terriglobales bacterium]|nr:bacillithiol biosynthesis cysteine-adding enzyme BshC [Terriglobales bacterium]
MSGDCIDQRRLPGTTKLFADYLYNFPALSKFYPAPFSPDIASLARHAPQVEYPDQRRAGMAADLTSQNAAAGFATRELLRQFAEPGCVAILAGQQVGLFGGPLLSLYKAMTAVLIAERLRAQGTMAVPIFWMATQDHDWPEVNHAWALDGTSQLHKIALASDPAHPGASVGPQPLLRDIEAALDQFAACCGADIAALRAAYHPGATMAEAFRGLLEHWFAPWGLIVFDPMASTAAPPLWADFYATAIARQPEFSRLLAERSEALTAAGFAAQVEHNPHSTLLFVERDGARQLLRAPVSDEVRAFVRDNPAHVSPAALLRPLLQDVAFPTLAQITGPAETAYLAQSAVLYQALAVRQPTPWPRASATLLDPRAQRLLAKYELTVADAWSDDLEARLARHSMPAGIDRQVSLMRAQFDREFAVLEEALRTLDPTLVDAAQGAVQKIRHQLEQLEARVARSHARRTGEIAAHAQHLSASLFPNRHLQERCLAAASFTTRYRDLPERLHASLDPTQPAHQVIALV